MVESKIFGEMRKMMSKVVTLDFKRENFKLLRELVNRVPWEFAFDCLG